MAFGATWGIRSDHPAASAMRCGVMRSAKDCSAAVQARMLRQANKSNTLYTSTATCPARCRSRYLLSSGNEVVAVKNRC